MVWKRERGGRYLEQETRFGAEALRVGRVTLRRWNSRNSRVIPNRWMGDRQQRSGYVRTGTTRASAPAQPEDKREAKRSRVKHRLFAGKGRI